MDQDVKIQLALEWYYIYIYIYSYVTYTSMQSSRKTAVAYVETGTNSWLFWILDTISNTFFLFFCTCFSIYFVIFKPTFEKRALPFQKLHNKLHTFNHYSTTLGWLRCRLSFSLLEPPLCVLGVLDPTLIVWTDHKPPLSTLCLRSDRFHFTMSPFFDFSFIFMSLFFTGSVKTSLMDQNINWRYDRK